MKFHRVIGYGAVLLSVMLLPLGVFAQCSMTGMSHGGHEGTHGAAAPKQELSKQVRAVLENDERRAEVMDAVAADPDLALEMIRRIAATPKGRALIRERLSAAPADPESAGDPVEEPEAPEQGHQH